MKKTFLIVAAAFLTVSAWGQGEQCVSHEKTVIQSEARCVDNGGISIGLTEEDGVKVACMQDKQVRGRCGPDGELTRLRAYTAWFQKLKHFEDACTTQGGSFFFEDPAFLEPASESFCMQAVPEVGASMFEEPLCNYRSVCPAVTVLCDRHCNEHSIAKLF